MRPATDNHSRGTHGEIVQLYRDRAPHRPLDPSAGTRSDGIADTKMHQFVLLSCSRKRLGIWPLRLELRSPLKGIFVVSCVQYHSRLVSWRSHSDGLSTIGRRKLECDTCAHNSPAYSSRSNS